MYAQIVVLTYQPPDIKTYTYDVPKNLEDQIKIGQLVSVPFGKRNPMGIVIHLRGVRAHLGGEIEIKPVSSIVFPTPILLPYQIELLKWMSEYYFAPMVNCLETMLPKIPRRSLKADRVHPRGVIQATSRLHPGGELIGQTLVLVPNINRIAETLANFPQAKNYVIYHNELNLSQKFNTWQKILGGGIDYIFGARSAIFAPCKNLQGIIIYDEHDGAYKDERSPYYDTLTIAQKIQSLTNCQIQIIDSSPKITTYFLFKQTRFVKILQTGFELTPKVKIVNMLDEKKAGNRSPISQILEDYIKLGFAKNKKILLFLNKKSESGHTWCKNCKYSDFAQKQPDVCPNCGSADIWFNSINVNSLASLVQKIIPSAKINIAASNNAHPRGVKAHPGGVLITEAIDIATAAVFYKLLPQKYDLVAHIRADSMLTIADYTSTERLYQQITDLKKITQGLLLLQTYNPESEVIRAASANNYLKFYKSELAMRKTLLYPPFALLVKLSLKGKLEDAVEQKAQQLFEFLSQSTVNGQLSTVSILGPFKPIFSGKVPKYNIIAKIPVGSYSLKEREKALTIIQPILKTLPREWQVEVEPNSIND